MTANPRAADLPDAGGYTFRCGCNPRQRIICTTHCQWQSCTRGDHTEACVRGERVGARTEEE